MAKETRVAQETRFSRFFGVRCLWCCFLLLSPTERKALPTSPCRRERGSVLLLLLLFLCSCCHGITSKTIDIDCFEVFV